VVILWPSAIVVSPLIGSLVELGTDESDAAVAGLLPGLHGARYTTSTDATAERGETSYFERMQRDHRDELRVGLARLRNDIAAGRAPKHAGTSTVLSWTKR
jgi:hypothetical protein